MSPDRIISYLVKKNKIKLIHIKPLKLTTILNDSMRIQSAKSCYDELHSSQISSVNKVQGGKTWKGNFRSRRC
jgi:hypothetical protein